MFILHPCRYIAVCHPILHRTMVHTHSIARRVAFYTGPVVVLSVLINVTKFLETKVVTHQRIITEADGSNVSITTYKIDITELRYATEKVACFAYSPLDDSIILPSEIALSWKCVICIQCVLKKLLFQKYFIFVCHVAVFGKIKIQYNLETL